MYNILLKIRQLPLSVLTGKLLFRLRRIFNPGFGLGVTNPVHMKESFSIKHSYLDIEKLDLSGLDDATISHLTGRYVNHEFDLLGSGWVRAAYNAKSAGFMDKSYSGKVPLPAAFDEKGNWLKNLVIDEHFNHSREIWTLVRGNYKPIDWQRDLKSGFRWDQRKPFTRQSVLSADQEGADLKMPWELSRMQHLLIMALAALKLEDRRKVLLDEIRNQILDFIAANPVGMGVNWMNSMDVGIRICNWLFTYDIISRIDNGKFRDRDFTAVFSSSILEHGSFIAANLEYRQGYTNNHFLFNLAGLLFAGLYFGPNELTKSWIPFCHRHLLEEQFRQFFEDGGHFEGSTCYHAFALELYLYAFGMLRSAASRGVLEGFNYNVEIPRSLGIGLNGLNNTLRADPANPLPGETLERAEKSVTFLLDLLKPDGKLVQIGDNDSGRLFKWTPVGEFLSLGEYKAKYKNLNSDGDLKSEVWDEDVLNALGLVSGLSAVFEFPKNSFMGDMPRLEASVVKVLWQGNKSRIEERMGSGFITLKKLSKLKYRKQFELFRLHGGGDITSGLHFNYFEDFQIVVFRSPRIFLTLCGTSSRSLHHSWGHVHNDKLSVTLEFDGKPVWVDPGTFVYTPSTDLRNQFRSVHAHNTVVTDRGEQNRWLKDRAGIFHLFRDSRFRIIELDKTTVFAEITYRGVIHRRRIKFEKDGITVDDFCNRKFEQNWNSGNLDSNGYGKWLS